MTHQATPTYLHLLQNGTFASNLRNLIGDREGHRIVIFDPPFEDSRGHRVTTDRLNDWAESCEVLFVHFLDYEKARFVNNLGGQRKIVWFFWGGDGFYLGRFANKFLLPKTKKLRWTLSLRHILDGGWKTLLRSVAGPLMDHVYPNREVLEAIRKVDLIVPVVPKDYKLLADRYPISADMFHCNYVNDLFTNPVELQPERNEGHILLGNSAHFSNNHLEIIDRLAKCDLGERKVIIPLSYGKRYYARYIKKYASEKLGPHQQVLQSLLPLPEYQKIVQTCDSIIMNHCRQQALGNAVLACWFRKNLFLNPRSGLYEFLEKKGFHVLSTDDHSPTDTLNEQQLDENRQRLHDVFGPETAHRRFGQLLKKLDE